MPDSNYVSNLHVRQKKKRVFLGKIAQPGRARRYGYGATILYGSFEMPRLCDVCGAPSTLLCTACRDINYCSRSCQKRDWKFHRELCQYRLDDEDTPGHFAAWLKANRKTSGVLCVNWRGPFQGQQVYFPINVRVADTIDELKRQIEAERGIPVDDQVIKHHVEMTPTLREMTMDGLRDQTHGGRWLPGSPRLVGTIANYMVSPGDTIYLETERTAPPLPTCTKCRQCVDDACGFDLDYPPDPADAPPLPTNHAPRNGPCPCGSGKKYKKCCGK